MESNIGKGIRNLIVITFLMMFFIGAASAAISITSPLAGSYLNGTETITFDRDGSTVDVYVDYAKLSTGPWADCDAVVTWTQIGSWVANPGLTQTWDTTVPVDGTDYCIRVRDVGATVQDRVGTMTVDNTPPTVGIVLADSALKVGDTPTVTFTFSEIPLNFDSTDVTVGDGSIGAVTPADGNLVWTAILTPTDNLEDGTNVVRVGTAWTDLAGNAPAGTTDSANYTIDTKEPTLTSAIFTDATLKAGETSVVTFIFSEAVTGFANDDLTIVNGTFGGAVASGDNITWTATFTPTVSIEDAENVITVNMTGVADAATNAGLGDTNSSNYAIDTLRPTITSITASPVSPFKTKTALVYTVQFSEAVTGFDAASDVTLNFAGAGAGNLDGSIIAAVDSDTYTVTLAGQDLTDLGLLVTNTSLVATVIAAGVADTAGNAGAVNSANTWTYDATAPTVVVTMDDAALMVADTSTVTFTFSEIPLNFDSTDVTVGDGSIGAVTPADGNLVWTAILTPTDNLEDGVNVVTVGTAWNDAATNAGVGDDSPNYTIDTKEPTLTSAIFTDAALKVLDTSLVTFTFSEAVTGFTNDDLTIINGGLTAVTDLGAGTIWTATFTPTDDLEDATNVITVNMTGVADAATNAGLGDTNSSNYAIDTKEPTVVVTMGSAALKVGETTTVTFTFSEAPTGFATGDVTVANGAIGDINADNPLVQTAIYTPNVGVEDNSNLITVGTVWTDAAANAPLAGDSSDNYTVDTLAPVISTLSDNGATDKKAGSTASITFNVVEGTGVDAGTLSVLVTTSADATISAAAYTGRTGAGTGGDPYIYTYTYTVPVGDYTATKVKVNLSDTAGNAATESVLSPAFNIDNTAPTVGIVLTDPTLTVLETSLVTITFSEAVTGFTNDDITTIDNGGLTAVASGDNITFTATFTPTDDLEDFSNVLTITKTGVADAAGNIGVGTTSSANYTIDTKEATILSITSATANGDYNAGRAINVTVTFSEAVTLAGGTLDVTLDTGDTVAITAFGPSTTATGTYTVGAGDTSADLDSTGIVLNGGTLVDTNGNTTTVALPGTTINDGSAIVIDTTAPVVSGSTLTTNGVKKIGNTITLTITADAAVYTAGAITVNSVAVTGFTNNGDSTYTATYTVVEGHADRASGAVPISVVLYDAAGNSNSASIAVTANTVSVDATKPTVNSATVDQTPTGAGVRTVTVVFSESMSTVTSPTVRITGLATNPYTVTQSSYSGSTWVGTFTVLDNDELATATISVSGAQDAATNTMDANSAAGTFAVDTVAPVVTNIDFNRSSYRMTQDSAVRMTITEDNTSNTVTIDGNAATESPAGTWTYTFAHGKAVVGRYSVSVIVTDAVGNNRQYLASYDVVADDAVVDSTAPTISVNSVESITQTSAIVITNSSETGFAHVHYGLDTNYGMVTTDLAVVADTNKNIPLASLTCASTYHYIISARDGNGNEASTTDANFTTTACTTYTYQFEFPKSGNGFGSGRFGDLISKLELQGTDAWNADFNMSDLLTITAGPAGQRIATTDMNNVYVYNDTDGWVTVPSTSFSTYSLYSTIEALNYFVFDLKASASGKSIRFVEAID
ncbi:MAG: Ig-like domain-containing protein [archaeon]